MMLTPNQDFSNFILPINVLHRGMTLLHTELGKIVADLEAMVHQYAQSSSPIETCANQHLDFLFKTRINALRYFIVHNLRMKQLPDGEVQDAFVEPRFFILKENLAFAFRVVNRSAEMLIKTIEDAELTESAIQDSIGTFEGMSYTDFVSALGLLLPSEALQPIVDWLTASLYLDYSISAGLIVLEKRVTLSDEKVNELTTFVAQSAQRFGAHSRMMRPKKQRDYQYVGQQDADADPENHFLTEVGLTEWAQNLDY